jgi:hypothetical protein
MHKTGTVLMAKAATTLAEVLQKRGWDTSVTNKGDKISEDFGKDYCHPNCVPHPQSCSGSKKCARIIVMFHLLPGSFQDLDKAFPDGYRLMQMIRDPNELVISAYLYHKTHNDCWNACPPGGPASLNASPTAKGLAMQAEAELKSTIFEQQQNAEIVCNEPGRLILSLDQFAKSSEDFDASMEKLFSFLFEGSNPGDEDVVELVHSATSAAEALDIHRWSAEKIHSNSHVTRDNRTSVLKTWKEDASLTSWREKVSEASKSLDTLLQSCENFQQ